MGNCWKLDQRESIILLEYENFRETFIGLPMEIVIEEEGVKTTMKQNPIEAFSKSLSLTVRLKLFDCYFLIMENKKIL